MPLLTGRFDPERFNAKTLAKLMYQGFVCGAVPWESLPVSARRILVDAAQWALDALVTQGVFEREDNVGLTTVVKVAFLKSYLNKLKQVDHGTTVAGTIAAVLLAGNLIDLGKLLGGGTQTEQVVEAGKAAAILTFWLVMKLIGKPVDINTVIQEASQEK